MQVEQWHVKDSNHFPPSQAPDRHRVVLAFGAVERLDDPHTLRQLNACFPEAVLAGCSTAGEITRAGVSDGGLTITSLTLARSEVRTASEMVPAMVDSGPAGSRLAGALARPDLRYLLVLSDGVHVNGSALVSGLVRHLPAGAVITGGLAGDSGRFSRTLVLDASGVHEKKVVAVAFYGESFKVGHGSIGGWEAFGPIRRVTRSVNNLVFELDGKPALAMYDAYLGDEAKDLPASGLLFPLALVSPDQRETGLIRTLLGVDRETGSLTFAGNVPQGGLVRLMHAGFDQLVEASEGAAVKALSPLREQAQLALLISCVGRRLLMGANTDREVDAAASVLGQKVALTGFYSNGEISPFAPTARCELHNQTMTITTLGEGL